LSPNSETLSIPGNSQRWIALLGWRDGPTDGVADYCAHLGIALGLRGYELEIVRVLWPERGWRAALAELRRRAEDWRGCWVLLQYTALGWSRRAFPLRFLQVLQVLRHNGALCVVVFHDALPYRGSRLIDRLRRASQLWVMRTAYRRTDHSVLPVSLDQVRWLPRSPAKAAFIPIGANLSPVATDAGKARASHRAKTVAVYGVTGEPATLAEVHDIGHILKLTRARVENLRLVVLGRGSAEAEVALRHELEGSGIEALVLGILSSEEITRELTNADVLLFVRGGVSSRRGSALAGIACGLPVVGYRSEETAFPVTEAGVVLVAPRDRVALAEALIGVLADDNWRQQLRRRSCAAQKQYFSWKVISGLFLDLLGRRADQ
jgi:glycosyltransferase involved in cell wall biosynthesis